VWSWEAKRARDNERVRVMDTRFVKKSKGREETNPSNKSVHKLGGGKKYHPRDHKRVKGMVKGPGWESPFASGPRSSNGLETSSLAIPHLFDRPHPIQLHQSSPSLHTFGAITVTAITSTPTLTRPFTRKPKWLRWCLQRWGRWGRIRVTVSVESEV